MISNSRKAARSSFARQRAQLLFSHTSNALTSNATPDAPRNAVTAAARALLVRNGLLGFSPARTA